MAPQRAIANAAGLGLLAALCFAAAAWWTLAPPSKGRLQPLDFRSPAQLPSFVDEAGASVSLEHFRGKTVVFNLWAAWCGPCIDEMPSLDRLAQRLPQDRFAVVAVSQDRSGAAAAKPVFDRLKLTRLKLYLDPERRLGAHVGVRGMPTTLIFGPDGVPLSFREGAAVWDSDEMVERIRALAASGSHASRR